MLSDIYSCRNCDLYRVQLPMIDDAQEADIIVMGLSAKKKRFVSEIPLDRSTHSGKLVSAMEDIAHKYKCGVYRTNLVKCVPLDENGRLRYPTSLEIKCCFSNFLIEQAAIQPRIVILLGKTVQQVFEKKMKFKIGNAKNCCFPYVAAGGCYYVASYHPAYVMRSKNRRDTYLQNFENLLREITLKDE